MSESDDLEFGERVAAHVRQPEPLEPTFESRLVAAARAAVARGEAPWQQRVASATDAPGGAQPRQPGPGQRTRGRGRWFTTPRDFRMSPLGGLAAAAGFAAVIAGTTLVLSRTRDLGAPGGVTAALPANHEVVRFVIAAPAARHVALVGDFNGWDPAATPLVRAGAAGTWVVTVPLTAGRYQYAFVVDGQTWLADPAAPLALEDEFGTPSSLVTVGGSRT